MDCDINALVNKIIEKKGSQCLQTVKLKLILADYFCQN